MVLAVNTVNGEVNQQFHTMIGRNMDTTLSPEEEPFPPLDHAGWLGNLAGIMWVLEVYAGWNYNQ